MSDVTLSFGSIFRVAAGVDYCDADFYENSDIVGYMCRSRRQQAIGNRQLELGNRQQAIGNRQQAIGNVYNGIYYIYIYIYICLFPS